MKFLVRPALGDHGLENIFDSTLHISGSHHRNVKHEGDWVAVFLNSERLIYPKLIAGEFHRDRSTGIFEHTGHILGVDKHHCVLPWFEVTAPELLGIISLELYQVHWLFRRLKWDPLTFPSGSVHPDFSNRDIEAGEVSDGISLVADQQPEIALSSGWDRHAFFGC